MGHKGESFVVVRAKVILLSSQPDFDYRFGEVLLGMSAMWLYEIGLKAGDDEFMNDFHRLVAVIRIQLYYRAHHCRKHQDVHKATSTMRSASMSMSMSTGTGTGRPSATASESLHAWAGSTALPPPPPPRTPPTVMSPAATSPTSTTVVSRWEPLPPELGGSVGEVVLVHTCGRLHTCVTLEESPSNSANSGGGGGGGEDFVHNIRMYGQFSTPSNATTSTSASSGRHFGYRPRSWTCVLYTSDAADE